MLQELGGVALLLPLTLKKTTHALSFRPEGEISSDQQTSPVVEVTGNRIVRWYATRARLNDKPDRESYKI